MKLILCVVVFAVLNSGAAVEDNPMSIPCDVHPGQTLYKAGREYPSGQCFDVYTHSYFDNTCTCSRTHKALLKCK